MKNNSNEIKKNFEFCDNKDKSFNENILCTQDDFHKSIEGNAIVFIIVYVFLVLFIALLFQLSKKDFSNRGKNNK